MPGVNIEELLVSIGADTTKFEVGAKRVHDQLKILGVEAETTGAKVKASGDKIEQVYKNVGNGDREILKIQNAMTRLQQITEKGQADFAKFDAAAKNTGSSFSQLSGIINGSLVPLTLVSSALTGIGFGLFAMAKDAVDAGAAMYDLSKRTGQSVETLSAFRLIAKVSNVSMEDLARGLNFFNKLIGEAARGSESAAAKLADFGIKPQEALKNSQAALAKVFETINKLPPGIERVTRAQEIFGTRNTKLVELIGRVGISLDEFMAKAREAGLVMSEDSARSAKEFTEKLTELEFHAQQVERTIGKSMIPALTKGFDELDKSLTKHKQLVDVAAGGVALFLNDYVTRLQIAIAVMDKFWQGGEAMYRTLGLMGAPTMMAGQAARRGAVTGAFSAAKPDAGTGYSGDEEGGAPKGSVRVGSPNIPEDAYYDADKVDRMVNSAQKKLIEEGFKKQAQEAKRIGDEASRKAKETRKHFLNVLHEWADVWNIPYSALREINSQSKVHRGKGHREGRAADISPQFVTQSALEDAKRRGFKVLNELYTGDGPSGHSTGPHYHIEMLSKGMAEAQRESLKLQGSLGDALGSKMADEIKKSADAIKSVQKAIEDQLTAIVGQPTELEKINKLLSDPQVAAVTDKRTAALLRELAVMNDIKDAVNDIGPPVLPNAGTSRQRYASGPYVDPKKFTQEFGPPPEMRESWLSQMGLTSKNMGLIFESSFQDAFNHTQDGFKGMLRTFVLDFAQAVEQMIIQAAAAKLAKKLFGSGKDDNSDNSDESSGGSSGGGLLGLLGGLFKGLFSHGSHGSGGGAAFSGVPFLGKFGHHAQGGPVSAGEWSMVGERGPELMRFGSAAHIYSNEDSRRMMGGGGAPAGGHTIHITNHYHVNGPGGIESMLSREGETQRNRRLARAIHAELAFNYPQQ